MGSISGRLASNYFLFEDKIFEYYGSINKFFGNFVRKAFNELLAREQIRIEHVNGIWKGRFGCLNGIRTQISSEKNLKFVLDIIKATVILYNISLKNMDIWNENLNEIEIESSSIFDSLNNEDNKLGKKKKMYSKLSSSTK
ncbi:18041_t:CDS:2 [Dentiscutata erythropus]|uniref:18041_t:CDS:1 n=1 Tax=Dentiscutata erythropus TaxID=1348616 RepID=A0A9N8WP15_9GLOM|nr:18041_t:CDS:2 [Dentiscutata erythropus]